MEPRTVWKLVIDSELAPDRIELAAAGVPELTEAASELRGVEIQRIDVVKGTTYVFVTGLEDSARALERSLSEGEKGMGVRTLESTDTELYANEPPSA